VGRLYADPLANSLPCLEPGVHALTVGDLGVAVGDISDSIAGDDGLAC
jgi:hypothetical protein